MPKDQKVEEMAEEDITEEELKEALAAVFKRAQTDAEFRALCLANPAEAIYEITGKRLPEGSQLSFAEPGDEKEGSITTEKEN